MTPTSTKHTASNNYEQMTKYLTILFFFFSCNSEKAISKKSYPQAIGDINYNESLDGDFLRCGTIPGDTPNSFMNSYYGTGGLRYKGEMVAIKEHILAHYQSPKIKNQTGFITVRFLVNCKGTSGMFRVMSNDFDLVEFKFSEQITKQILQAVKTLKDWQPLAYHGKTYDYYQYLTIKIIDSEIKEITP